MSARPDRKVVVVTGATDGLGRGLAARLVDDGAILAVHGRNQERIDDTLRELQARNPGAQLHPYRADLSSLDQTRDMAKALKRDFPRIDVLINNAGIGTGPPNTPRQESADGHELRFAVNYLAGFLLTTLLLDTLARAPSARIVNVSSIGQQTIDFDNVMLKHGYEGMRAYRQSKLAQILFTLELTERLRASGRTNLTVNAVHPSSLMPTKMVREAWDHTLSTVDQGVEAVWQVAMSPALEGTSGRYFNVLEEARANAQAYDAPARRRLWELSEELVPPAVSAS